MFVVMSVILPESCLTPAGAQSLLCLAAVPPGVSCHLGFKVRGVRVAVRFRVCWFLVLAVRVAAGPAVPLTQVFRQKNGLVGLVC